MEDGEAVAGVPSPKQRDSGPRSRLKQIIEWCGVDFEGVIAFDEVGASFWGTPRGGGAFWGVDMIDDVVLSCCRLF